MIFLQTTTTQTAILQENLIRLVYIPIIVWVSLILIYLIFLSKKFTFGKWTKENPNPYGMETMALPRGAMRGILTLSLLFGVLLLEIFAIENPTFETNIGQFIVAFQMMLAFYFGSKVMHHLTSTDRAKSEHMANSIVKVEETKVAGAVVASAASSEDFNDEEAEG